MFGSRGRRQGPSFTNRHTVTLKEPHTRHLDMSLGRHADLAKGPHVNQKILSWHKVRVDDLHVPCLAERDRCRRRRRRERRELRHGRWRRCLPGCDNRLVFFLPKRLLVPGDSLLQDVLDHLIRLERSLEPLPYCSFGFTQRSKDRLTLRRQILHARLDLDQRLADPWVRLSRARKILERRRELRERFRALEIRWALHLSGGVSHLLQSP